MLASRFAPRHTRKKEAINSFGSKPARIKLNDAYWQWFMHMSFEYCGQSTKLCCRARVLLLHPFAGARPPITGSAVQTLKWVWTKLHIHASQAKRIESACAFTVELSGIAAKLACYWRAPKETFFGAASSGARRMASASEPYADHHIVHRCDIGDPMLLRFKFFAQLRMALIQRRILLWDRHVWHSYRKVPLFKWCVTRSLDRLILGVSDEHAAECRAHMRCRAGVPVGILHGFGVLGTMRISFKFKTFSSPMPVMTNAYQHKLRFAYNWAA